MNILSVNRVSKSYQGGDGFAVNSVSLSMERGEIMALVGESGSGKTTLLRLIAGFERPDSGSIILEGRTVADGSLFVEPEKRGIGVVFQDYALFPHLTVRENMEFGLGGMGAAERRDRVAALLELTGTESLIRRYPHELSGGQKQRIAVARAMAPGPSLILFDEPFSSVDNMLRSQMRTDIKRILRKAGSTALFITHDTKDAMAMADSIVMLRKGRCIQSGTPDELYNRPVNAWVAGFFGKTNLIRARVTEGGLETAFGVFPHKGKKRKKGEVVMLSIRPESFVMKNPGEDCICGKITGRNFMGDYSEIVCEVHTGRESTEEVVIRVSPGKSCDGKECWFKPRKKKIHILPETGDH